MVSRDGQRWQFDAGTFALDLLVSGGPGQYVVFEVLHTPGDLAEWLRESRLAPLPELRITAAELARIRNFRDLLHGVAATVARGGIPAERDLEAINAFAGEQPVPRIDPVTRAREWRGPVTGAQVLGSAVADAIALLTGPQLDRLRECAADDCSLLFVDTSRPGTRRWCSMQRCGNRNKVRTHRDRHSGEPAAAAAPNGG
jgi:predicted RNA-binding Zn ribbon-like protein